MYKITGQPYFYVFVGNVFFGCINGYGSIRNNSNDSSIKHERKNSAENRLLKAL